MIDVVFYCCFTGHQQGLFIQTDRGVHTVRAIKNALHVSHHIITINMCGTQSDLVIVNSKTDKLAGQNFVSFRSGLNI